MTHIYCAPSAALADDKVQGQSSVLRVPRSDARVRCYTRVSPGEVGLNIKCWQNDDGDALSDLSRQLAAGTTYFLTVYNNNASWVICNAGETTNFTAEMYSHD